MTDIISAIRGGGGGHGSSNDLFNIVREMTLVPRSAMSLQPENRKQWSHLNCDITSGGTERNRGGLIKGEEVDDFVKRSLHTYLDFWTPPLSEQEKKVEEYEGKRTKTLSCD